MCCWGLYIFFDLQVEDSIQVISLCVLGDCIYFLTCRLKIAFKWLMRAFSGFLASDQVLLLWDRILSFDSLEILPGQSETFCVLSVSDSPKTAWACVMISWPSAHPSTEIKTLFSWTLGMSPMSSFALWYGDLCRPVCV